MLLLRSPGVYRAQGDTYLLRTTLHGLAVPADARVLDLGTGTGALSVAAAMHGAQRVTAVDVSRRAVLTARLNARLRGLPVQVLRGDLYAPVAGSRFDLILANPPYVISESAPPARGRARAWDAGPDGRLLLDRICSGAPRHLTAGGTLLLVHSALSGVDATLATLRDAGLASSVVARSREPFGPVMRARARALESRGLIGPGQRHEELVVIRADKPEHDTVAADRAA